MKIILFAASLLLSTISFAYGSFEVIPKNNDVEINPAYITHFNEAQLNKANVGVAAYLVGGAWVQQKVFVSLGYQEGPNEGLDTFIMQVTGDITSSEAYDVVGENGDSSVLVVVKTNIGPWDDYRGEYKNGTTTHYLTIKSDYQTLTGYSETAELRKEYTIIK